MESALFKQLVKIIIIVSIPIAFLLLFLLKRPVVTLAYFTGVFLGIFHLRTLFDFVSGLLNAEAMNNKYILIGKYFFSFILSFGVLSFTLYKSQIVGFPVLFGLLTVPVIITIFSIWKGISLYRNS